MAHPKHQLVRQRYDYGCGYCGVSEKSAGGDLSVDHFRPVSLGGDDSNENLVYACARCNLYKADFLPTSDQLVRGLRLLHPLLDNVAAHIRPAQHNGYLDPLTETGRFHIEVLHLNRPALIEHRIKVQQDILASEIRRILVAENREHGETIAALHRYIADLEVRLGLNRE